jgi:glyoxylase-like metal-dependent hydrolase (beta-lactamase superfamily II)
MTLVAAVGGEDRLVLTGDTIFPGSCGRLDLPGSSVDAMFSSLSLLRAMLDDALPLFPGHAYNGASSTVAREKTSGLLRQMSMMEWQQMMAQ